MWRGFSKQNLIRSHRRASLVLETLDALMRISLADILIDEIMSHWYEKMRGTNESTL